MAQYLEGPRGRTVARGQPRRSRMKFGLLGVAILGVAALVLPVATGSAQFVWNATASAPAGLYRIERRRWHTGDRVAVLPSDALAVDLDVRGVLPRGKLLIKRVVAGAGDCVCRYNGTVFVNGAVMAQAKSNDSKGHPLPSWLGCITLNERQVFLLGDTAGSYDGRYFGATQASEIVGQVVIVFAF